MGGPEFELWLSTHRSAGGLGEGSVGGEQWGPSGADERPTGRCTRASDWAGYTDTMRGT